MVRSNEVMRQLLEPPSYKKRAMIQPFLLPCLSVASALASAKSLAFLDAKPLSSHSAPALVKLHMWTAQLQQTTFVEVNSQQHCCNTVQCLLCGQDDNRARPALGW